MLLWAGDGLAGAAVSDGGVLHEISTVKLKEANSKAKNLKKDIRFHFLLKIGKKTAKKVLKMVQNWAGEEAAKDAKALRYLGCSESR